jgi:hypothetical protein
MGAVAPAPTRPSSGTMASERGNEGSRDTRAQLARPDLSCSLASVALPTFLIHRRLSHLEVTAGASSLSRASPSTCYSGQDWPRPREPSWLPVRGSALTSDIEDVPVNVPNPPEVRTWSLRPDRRTTRTTKSPRTAKRDPTLRRVMISRKSICAWNGISTKAKRHVGCMPRAATD